MKLSREQKIRIARFLTLHPHVTQTSVAELFDVSCSTVAGIMHEYAIADRPKFEDWVNFRYGQFTDALNSDQEPLFI